MTVAATIPVGNVAAPRRAISTRVKRYGIPGIAVLAGLIALAIAGYATHQAPPTWLDAHVKPEVDKFYNWSQIHNTTNWVFIDIFKPIGDAIHTAVTKTLWVFRTLRWPGVLAMTALIGYRTGGRRAAITGAVLLAACGLLGFWDDTLITVSLMLVAVAISLVIGIPLGIWSGLSQRAEKVMRSTLDTAQVMPAYVYLLPVVVFFGIQEPPAVIVTVIFAVPPAVRLTSLGIRNVAETSTEVGTSFGCTPAQLLFKVRLPLARRAILLGINQVIMLAFGIVVIASFVGVGGLGQSVLDGLDKNDVGLSFAPGLALVFAAIAIDRVTTGQRTSRPRLTPATGWRAKLREPRSEAAVGVAAVVVVAVIAKIAKADQFPTSWNIDVVKPANKVATWVADNFRSGIPIVGGTASFSDFFTIHVLDPVRDLLQHAAWFVVVAIVALVGYVSAGWRLALLCGLCLVGVAALGVGEWALAMDTLSQILIITVLSVAIAIPLGIWTARNRAVEAVMRPLLDAAQVMPAFVYLIPVLFLFNIGRVPGIIATIVYAIPPAIRLTALGLREVPYTPREAAISFGATKRQELFKVQLPLAARAIMLAINQTIILVLSMVVIAALIGAGGLGLETVYGFKKKAIGQGMAGGIALVLLAIVLDRITQAWGTRKDARRIPAA